MLNVWLIDSVVVALLVGLILLVISRWHGH